MAYAALAVMAVSAVAGAVGSYKQAQAQRSAAEYTGDVQKQNAKLAEMQAQDALARGEDEEDAYRRKLAGLLGSQRAGMASSGIDLSSGSAVDLFGDTAALGEMDALKIRQNAEREAWAYRVQGTGAENAASMAYAEAANTSPGTAGFLTLLGGASQMASSWYAGRPTATKEITKVNTQRGYATAQTIKPYGSPWPRRTGPGGFLGGGV